MYKSIWLRTGVWQVDYLPCTGAGEGSRLVNSKGEGTWQRHSMQEELVQAEVELVQCAESLSAVREACPLV